jgi:hypothetical protein
MSFDSSIPLHPKYHWGTFVWAFIHTLTICNVSQVCEKDFFNSKDLLTSVKDIIPCGECKEEYIRHLKQLEDITYSDFEKDGMIFFKWTFHLHNFVNRKLGKKEFDYTSALKKWVKNI